MTIVLIVEKNGTLKEHNIKGDLNPDEFYKIAKFKNATDFENEASWEVDVLDKTYNISLFAKTSGRAGQENKYELPPPVDEILYFGRCLLVNEDGTDLTINTWNIIYEALFGGFDDIGEEDEEEDEEEDLTGVTLTKTGYMKDSFITDDGEVDSGGDSYVENVVEILNGSRTRTSLRKLSNEDMENESDGNDSDFFVCTDELEEEDYE
jgi:hypothetical protein